MPFIVFLQVKPSGFGELFDTGEYVCVWVGVVFFWVGVYVCVCVCMCIRMSVYFFFYSQSFGLGQVRHLPGGFKEE